MYCQYWIRHTIIMTPVVQNCLTSHTSHPKQSYTSAHTTVIHAATCSQAVSGTATALAATRSSGALALGAAPHPCQISCSSCEESHRMPCQASRYATLAASPDQEPEEDWALPASAMEAHSSSTDLDRDAGSRSSGKRGLQLHR